MGGISGAVPVVGCEGVVGRGMELEIFAILFLTASKGERVREETGRTSEACDGPTVAHESNV